MGTYSLVAHPEQLLVIVERHAGDPKVLSAVSEHGNQLHVVGVRAADVEAIEAGREVAVSSSRSRVVNTFAKSKQKTKEKA